MKEPNIQGFALDRISSITFPEEEPDMNSTQKALSRLFEKFSERSVQNDTDQKTRRTHSVPPRRSLLQRIFGTNKSSTASSNASSTDTITVDHGYTEETINSLEEKCRSKVLDSGDEWFNVRIADQISSEAHCSARFFLSSMKSRIAPRIGCRPSISNAEIVFGNICVVTDFGMVAEFNVSDPNNNSILSTFDDRDALLLQKTHESSHSPLQVHKEFIRSCQLSPNCIAISWGFQDGVVVIYRKIQRNDGTTIGWKAIHLIRPLEDAINFVEEKLCEIYDKNDVFASGLLRVSEVCPIKTSKREGADQGTFLCISRAGGFLELIFIPEKMYSDPLIPTQKHPKAKAMYTDNLSDLSSIPSLNHVGLSTTSVHSDITAMTIQKIKSTQESSEFDYVIYTAGNSCNRPDSVHVQYIGMWGVSFENEKTVRIVNVTRYELSNLGPSVTILPPKGAITNRISQEVISMHPPISSLKSFFVEQKGYFLAVHDYNGGITILNASQSIDCFKGANESQSSFSLISSRFDTFDRAILDIAFWKDSTGETRIVACSDDNMISISKLSLADGKAEVILTGSLSVQKNQVLTLLNTARNEILLLAKVRNDSSSTLSLDKVDNMVISKCISALAGDEDFVNALKITRSFKDTDDAQQSLDSYLMKKWKQNGQVSVLLQISDRYAIAKEIFQLEFDRKTLSKLAFDDLHFLIKEAHKRFGPTLTNDNHSNLQLDTHLLRIGTYILLQPFINKCVLSSKNFYSRFLRLNLTDLIMQLSLVGNITAVCLVLVRHWYEFEDSKLFLKIIENIPWLLPYKSFEIIILAAESEPNHQRDLILSYLDSVKVVPYADNDDRILAEKALVGKKYIIGENQFSVSAWCIPRARQLIALFKDFDGAIDLLTGALRVLEAKDPPNDTLSTILYLRASIHHMKNMIQSVVHFDLNYTQWLETLSLEEFQSIGVHDIVNIMLKDCYDCNQVIFRIRSILSPMFSENQEYDILCWNRAYSLNEAMEYDQKKELEIAITQFYLRQLSSEVDLMMTSNELNIIPQTVFCCRDIVRASASCLPIQERLIRCDTNLMHFVVDVCKILLRIISPLLLDQLWEMYECLPCKQGRQIDRDSISCLCSVDSIYRTLAATQIIFKWNPHAISSFQIERFFYLHEKVSREVSLQDCKTELVEMGTILIYLLSNGFLEAVKTMKVNEIDVFVLSFLSNIHEFHEICLLGLISLEDIIDVALISPLLQGEHFAILRKLELSGSIRGPSLQKEIIFWCREIVSNQKLANSKKLSTVVQLSHNISYASPIIFATLSDTRKYLECISFMIDLMAGDSIPSFDSFQSESPMKIIEKIIQASPGIITIDCPEWNDHSYAEKNMEALCSHIERNDSVSTFSLLPGKSVLRLATLIGVNDPKGIFFLKNRLIHLVHQSGLHEAAGAMCIVLLHDAVSVEARERILDENSCNVLFSSIYICLSLESHLSFVMKRYIFRKSLIWFEANMHHCTEEVQNLSLFFLTEFIDDPLTSDENSAQATCIKNICSYLSNLINDTDAIISFDDVSSIEDIQNLISDKIIPWCSFVLSNKSSAHSILNVVLLALRTTVPFLHSIDMNTECYKAIQSCLSSIRKVKSQYLDSNASFSLQVTKPNDDIVKQLVQMGYSINGARRSVISTGNKGVSAALSWAVAHESDLNFDSQLVFLAEKGVKFEIQDLLEDLLSTEIILDIVLHHFLEKINKGITSGLTQPKHMDSRQVNENRLKSKGQSGSENISQKKHRIQQSDNHLISDNDHFRKLKYEASELDLSSMKHALIQNGKKIMTKNRSQQQNTIKMQLAMKGKSILQKTRKEMNEIETKMARSTINNADDAAKVYHHTKKKEREVSLIPEKKDKEKNKQAAKNQWSKGQREVERDIAKLAAEKKEQEAATHAAIEAAAEAQRIKEQEAARQEAAKLAAIEAAAEAQRLKEQEEQEAAKLAAIEAAADAQRIKEQEEQEAARQEAAKLAAIEAAAEAQRLKEQEEQEAARQEAAKLAAIEAAAEAQRLKEQEEQEAAKLAAIEAAAEAQRLKEQDEQEEQEAARRAGDNSCPLPLISDSENHSVSSIFSNDIGLDASDGWGFDCSVASNQYSDDNSISVGWDDDLDLLDI